MDGEPAREIVEVVETGCLGEFYGLGCGLAKVEFCAIEESDAVEFDACDSGEFVDGCDAPSGEAVLSGGDFDRCKRGCLDGCHHGNGDDDF